MQIPLNLKLFTRIQNTKCHSSYLLLSRVKYTQYTYYVYVLPIDGIQYRGATVAFLGPTHRFLYSHGVYVGDFYVGDQKST